MILSIQCLELKSGTGLLSIAECRMMFCWCFTLGERGSLDATSRPKNCWSNVSL